MGKAQLQVNSEKCQQCLRQWLQLGFNSELTLIRLLFDCDLTSIELRFDFNFDRATSIWRPMS